MRSLPTVLVVDDDRLLRAALGRVLRRAFEVLSAGSCDEALPLLGRESIDLALVDGDMAGGDGLAFLRRVRERHPEVRRVLMVATPPRGVEDAAELLIGKPCPSDLPQRLARMLSVAGPEEGGSQAG